MKIKLLQYSPISMAIIGARVCYDSFENSDSKVITENNVNYYENIALKEIYSKNLNNFKEENEFTILYDEIIGENDKKLIGRLINSGHHSILEHIYYTFYISGISRLSHVQLIRHRIASYSVQSTRYVLKKILKNIKTIKDVDKYFVFSPNIPVEFQREEAYKRVMVLKQLKDNYGNDDLKYLLPENLKTELVMSMNCRELRHFLKLRLDRRAHFEIRELAKNIYSVLPDDHKRILFFDINVEEV